MPDRTPYIERLRAELDHVEELYLAMLDASTIVRDTAGSSEVVIIVAPDHDWRPSSSEAAALQMTVSRTYSDWITRVRLLFLHAPANVLVSLDETDKAVQAWIERSEWTWTLPPTIEQAKVMASEWMTQLRGLLDIASTIGEPGLQLVPDTSSLLDNPDLASYARSFDGGGFTVVLVPTVLGELDRLKDQGKNPEVRDKARSVSRRLKGLRDKGSLAAGVNLTKTIIVKTEAREPKVDEIVDWLDPSVADDRIVATALRLQSDHPAASVVIITSDMNMQTKADAIGLPYEETPPSPASLKANLEAEITYSTTSGQNHIQIALTNTGPSRARNIMYSLSSTGGPPRFAAGPWKVSELRRDAADTQPVIGLYSDPSEVTATWTDDEGDQHRTWEVHLPAPPTAARGTSGSRQRGR